MSDPASRLGDAARTIWILPDTCSGSAWCRVADNDLSRACDVRLVCALAKTISLTQTDVIALRACGPHNRP